MLPQIIIALIFVNNILCAPVNDKALYDDNNVESRGSKNRRPCRGRTPDGRTFFDWSLSYVDVNYNYNYNINCGGGGGGGHQGGGGQKPIISNVGGGGAQKPILSGLLQGGNVLGGGGNPGGGLLGPNGPVTFVQSQVQNILANPPNFGSQSQQDGIFSGSGLGSIFESFGSLFDNGLFSGIFDFNRPSPPPINSPPNNRPIINTPAPTVRPTTPTPSATTTDPDDIIYNDEKPVHEDHDDVLPDSYNRPGQYLVAQNPVFGQYVYRLDDGRGYNTNRRIRQFNREINKFTKPFVDAFGGLF